MRYFYDTEFIEDGKTIELISIGVVSEDGREFYAVNKYASWSRLVGTQFSWVRENVWKHLPVARHGVMALDNFHPDVMPCSRIADNLLKFFRIDVESGEPTQVELWADYGAYDHVALCQLWGPMMNLPAGMPMRTNDLIQLAESLGVAESEFPKQDPATLHHALYDAHQNLKVFTFLKERQAIKEFAANAKAV